VFPGMAIGAAVLGFNLLGDALRDALDPRQIFRPKKMGEEVRQQAKVRGANPKSQLGVAE